MHQSHPVPEKSAEQYGRDDVDHRKPGLQEICDAVDQDFAAVERSCRESYG